MICHGSPQDEDRYISGSYNTTNSFRFIRQYYPEINICFFGHTHVPIVIDEQGKVFNNNTTIKLKADVLYLINPGSIGQPRDRDPRASFGVYDDSKAEYVNIKIPYAFQETQQKIMYAGLSPVLAQRLASGR